MRVVVIGAGLGGLAAALRLQGAGHEVVVVDRRAHPGGRAYRLEDGGFTWDMGPSLITMPWVLEETFAAAGLELGSEVRLRRLDPFYRIAWSGEERSFEFSGDRDRMVAEIARFSSRDARAFDGFMAALRPVYEQGILAAGRRPFLRARDFAAFVPSMVRLRAASSLWRFVARHFEHPRVREAFSFHSLFIGGDPYRVPAIYGALAYLQYTDGVWYADGGVYSLIEAMARPLDVRGGLHVDRIEVRGGRATGVLLADGSSIEADAVVSNADVLALPALLGRRPPVRRLRPTMSSFLLFLGLDRRLPRVRHHNLVVDRDYRGFIADVTRRGRIAAGISAYVNVPSRTEPEVAPDGGESLSALVPVPNLASGLDWDEAAKPLRERTVAALECTLEVPGLAGAIRSEHWMTPRDFETELAAVQGNAFSVEPTLGQSAYFRQPNRDRSVAGLYHVGAGTHPGGGIPGVVLGAEITTRLIEQDRATLRA